MLSGNVTVDPQFVNANLYDYRLRAGSPAINAGRTPGTSPEGYSLVPSNEYVHGSCTATRTQSGAMDAGAHEFGNNAAPQCSSYDPTIALTPSVTLSQSSVVAGNTVMATVMLSKPAPPNGAPVTFEVNGSAVTAASTVTVPAGGTYITAPLATTWISSTTPVTVMAMVQGKSGSAAMTVTPAPANLVDFSNTNPSTNTFTVSLSGPAPAGGAVVQLSVDNPAAGYVQPTVTVPAGTLTASVQTFGGVVDVATTVTVTASYSGVQMSDTMIAPVPTLSWIGVGAPTIPSGSNRTGNIYLMNSAPYGGALIQLTSSSPSFVVPATMLVPQGSLNVLFPVSANTVTANTSVVVTATYNGAVATVPVTVTP